MRRQILAPVTAGVLLALAGTAHAGTKTTTFTVSATVVENCVISAADMNLGNFFGDNDLNATSDITVRCTDGTDFTVNLSPGSSGDYASRTLKNGADSLVFNLYTDDDHTKVWGDGISGGTFNGGGLGGGMGVARTLTVRGQLLASENAGPVDAGLYTDLITATINY
jgi:spore coat protein U-like protein